MEERRTRRPAGRSRRRPRRRHRRLWVWALLLLGCVGFFWWSNHTLEVDRFTYTSPRLPAGFDGCRIVQLTDLHGARFGQDGEALLDRVRQAAPDYIVLTGDIQDSVRATPQSYTVELCRALRQIASVYFVTGNHEWALPGIRELKRALAEEGVEVLSNEALPLVRGGDTIVLAGIDDPNGFADQKTPEQLAEEVRGTYGDPFWILLAHRNNWFEGHYSRLGADLVISGHGHGGLIRLPFTDGLVSVERTLFPSYTDGFYEVDGAELFVSRGLGNTGKGFRLFNRPQVVVLTLERG